MSQDRIQEHFSELYEGTLDPGLAQQLRYRLESDPDLAQEYVDFSALMVGLNAMPEEQISVPANLSTIIATKLETSAKPQKSGLSWLRALALGGAACALLVSTYFTIKSQSSGPIEAGLVSGVNKAETLAQLDVFEIKSDTGLPVIHYKSSGPQTVTISDPISNQVVKTFELNGNSLESALKNPGSDAAVFSLGVKGRESMGLQYVVVPGTSTETELKGSGTLATALQVVSTRHKVLIDASVGQLQRDMFEWDFKGESAIEDLGSLLGKSAFSISQSKSGVVKISVAQ